MKLDVNNDSLRLFYLLLATDVVFIILHILYLFTGIISKSYFSIEQDQGYAELFQYIKEYWIALVLGLLAIQKRSPLYLGWSLLFFYLLLDDSLKIHERLGGIISNELGLSPAFKLRAQDFGEIIVSACVGFFFLIFIAIAYRFGDRMSRETSRHLIMMLFALALFGIVVDLIHIIVLQSPSLEPLLALVEDGGEMLVMSVIAWFVFLLPKRLSQDVSLPGKHHRVLQE